MADTPTAFELAGPKILLEGPSGSGKTYALGTLVDWALKQTPVRNVHVLFSENGLESLLGYWTKRKMPVPTNLRWHVLRSSSIGLDALIAGANQTGKVTMDTLFKTIDPDRHKNNPWETFLRCLTDLPDDRTSTMHGNIGTWGASTILVNDSLSETANICMRMVTGNKTSASLPEYGVAQGNLLNWLRYMTQSFQGTFVMTAHVQRQMNEVTGAQQLMTKAIGKAMADDIPQLFSETIYTQRDGTNWYWDTAASNVDTKTRYLPIQAKIPPNFALIMDQWLERSRV